MAQSGPIKLAPSAQFNAVGVGFRAITLAADVDLTLAAGQTGGYSARAVAIGGTGGFLSAIGLDGVAFVAPVAANTTFQCGICFITFSGTTCTPVGVIL